jgi:hypothetical protein
MPGNVDSSGVPKCLKMVSNCVSSEVPVKSGLPLIISANIHPILHMSTGVEYFLDPNNTSGARYLTESVQVILNSFKK